jgi:hypothetical protein
VPATSQAGVIRWYNCPIARLPLAVGLFYSKRRILCAWVILGKKLKEITSGKNSKNKKSYIWGENSDFQKAVKSGIV